MYKDSQTTNWRPIETAPKDGTLIEVMFDPATAEIDGDGKNMAEFYVRGCTRRKNPEKSIIQNVRFKNGYFRPVILGRPEIDLYAILSVNLTHWRKQNVKA